MRQKDLIEELRQVYTPKRGYGVVRVNVPTWENIPFVVPPPPPVSIKGPLPHTLLAQAIKTLNALPSYSGMNQLDKLINYLFVRREVVQSSRLEGTWSTIDHVLTPGELISEKTDKDEHKAVRSYAHVLEKTIEEARQKKEKIFTLGLIREIHKKIVEHDPQSTGVPGKLRTKGEPGAIVTIGGFNRKEESIYNPPPPQYVRKCLQSVIEWYSNSQLAQLGDAGAGGLTLPVRLAIGHSHFEAVHPFTDGNGRTGRSLWPLQMVCAGNMPLYLSGYVEAKKDDYSKALEAAQKKLNYVPLVTFICHAIIESDLEVKKSREAISQLESTWQERGKFRQGSTAQRALKILLHTPIISSALLQEELDVSGPASTVAIKQLMTNKIIRHRRNENRMRIYAAEELIHILSRPFGSDIDLALEKAQRLMAGDGLGS